MGQLLFGLAALIVVGSVCGIGAALRIGSLARRLTSLERRLAPGTAQSSGRRTSHVWAAHRPAAPSAAPMSAAAVVPASPLSVPVLASPVPQPVPQPVPASPQPASPRPPRPPVRSPEADWWHGFELRAGTRWITWLGAGALVIAAALFVKLAIDRGWLGPAARLALGVAGGVGLLVAGRRAHRAEMRPLAQGLFGAGLGVLYVATYVAFASYGLIARELVLAAMIGVTITGCGIAIRHDAQPVAVLALLGGLLTPIAVSSGGGSRDALFAYLLVLDLGAVAVALVRGWRALEVIALAGTWVLFGGWLARAPAAGAGELAWLAVFHAAFVGLPFGFHVYRRRGAGPGRLLVSVAGAAAAVTCAAELLYGERGAIGAAVLAMAAIYAALEVVARRGRVGGRASFGFVALAVALATLAVPLLLRGHAITIAWSLEAPALLVLGFHDRGRSLRIAALGVLGLAMLHGVGVHWPSHAAGFRPFANLAFAGALIAPLAAGLFAWVHAALRGRGDARDRWDGIGAALAGGAIVLVLVHAEVARWFALQGRPDLADAVLALVWAAGALLALGAAWPSEARGASPGAGAWPMGAVGMASTLAALVAAALCLSAYKVPAPPDTLLALNPRFAGALATAIALAANAAALARRDPAYSRLAWAAAIAGLGVAIGAEAYLHYAALDPLAHAGRRAHTALSIAWSGYAALLLAIGFARDRRPLRLAGLGLLGLVAAKLLLVDLAGAPQAYRVLSFLIAGALMIAVSYAYHKLERRPPEA